MYLAHAGKEHTNETEGIAHLLQSNPLLFVLLLIFIVLFIGGVLYMISKKSLPTALIILMLVLLVGGMGLYALLPALSIILLLAGFSLSLFLTINGLRQ